MASNPTFASTPLTFELPRPLVDQIHRCRGRLGLNSVSAVVRHALASFNFVAFQAPRREPQQISVRLSPAQKRVLFHHARRKKVSAGELLRAALEALFARSADGKARPARAGGKAAGRKAAGKRKR
jgi:Arc/MetJ-type ribon-helix-helix transcriptional regulator